MPGPYLISIIDLATLSSPPPKDAVIPDSDAGHAVQCVFLIKYYTNSGPASGWKQGDRVKDSPDLTRGTAIATFNAQGRYSNASSGNHACFFIEFLPDKRGILVLEQNVAPDPNKIQTRNILYRGGKGSPSNDADAYSVIL